jgi:hypothetical protein
MITTDRSLTTEQKAAYFDMVVDAFIRWNNADLDSLRKDPKQKDNRWKYRSRQDAAGYEVFTMLGKEHIIKTAPEAEGQMSL